MTRGNSDPYDLELYMLPSAYERVATPSIQNQNSLSEELWVPIAISKQLKVLIEQDLNQYFEGRYDVSVDREDYLASQKGDPLFLLRLVVGGASPC